MIDFTHAQTSDFVAEDVEAPSEGVLRMRGNLVLPDAYNNTSVIQERLDDFMAPGEEDEEIDAPTIVPTKSKTRSLSLRHLTAEESTKSPEDSATSGQCLELLSLSHAMRVLIQQPLVAITEPANITDEEKGKEEARKLRRKLAEVIDNIACMQELLVLKCPSTHKESPVTTNRKRRHEDDPFFWDAWMEMCRLPMKRYIESAEHWKLRLQGGNSASLKILDNSISKQLEKFENAKASGECDNDQTTDQDLYVQILKAFRPPKFLRKMSNNAKDDIEDETGKKAQGPSKIDRVVDRRASKGRKIRYAPIPKLQNFMVSRPRVIDSDTTLILDKLLSSMFLN
eukprot:GHVO01006638.1.p2 GENE.GHVO01006638.1~~GHVO01006638.1.p2  ORF type:complete len:341 (+),score=55.85 GHVO01006638.1:1160-2182(+)